MLKQSSGWFCFEWQLLLAMYGNIIFEGVPGPINRVHAQNSDFAIYWQFLSQPAVVSTVRGNLRWHWVLNFVYSMFTWLLQLTFYRVLVWPFCQASLVSYVMVWSPEAPCHSSRAARIGLIIFRPEWSQRTWCEYGRMHVSVSYRI